MRLDDDIKRLILYSLTGELSHEDNLRLEEWLKEPENRKAYDALTDNRAIADRIKVLEHFDKADAWKKLSRRIDRERGFLFGNWRRIAAVVILFLILGGGRLIYIRMLEIPGMNPPLPKTSVPMLRLASGEEIPLSGDSVYETEQARLIDRKGCLTYFPDSDTGKDDETYHVVATPCGKAYRIVLSEGTTVWLNACSTLKFPVNFSSVERKVIVSGELYFEVKKDSLRPFKVLSGMHELEVLGTSFNIRNYTEEPYAATLISGSVSYRYKENNVVLKPGQQAVSSGEEIRIEEINTASVIAWKNGYFIFENKPLKDIMRELENWYGIRASFANAELGERRFSIEFQRSYSLDEVVHILQEMQSLKFKLEDNVLIINNI